MRTETGHHSWKTAKLRANLKEVPPTSDGYKRHLKKFDEQEMEIEKRQKELARLREVCREGKEGVRGVLGGAGC